MDDFFTETAVQPPADALPPTNGDAQASFGLGDETFGGDFGSAPPPDFGSAPPPDFGSAPPPDFGSQPIMPPAPAGNVYGGEDMFSAPPAGSATAESGFYTMSSTPAADQVPTPLQEWKQEQILRLQQKAEIEAQEKAEILSAAEKERELFYAQRMKQIGAKKQTNREKEEVQAKIEGESTWESVLNMTDAARTDGGADLSRMRQLLLKLKHKRSE